MSNGSDVTRRIAVLVQREKCSGSLPAEEIARGAHLSWANAVSLLMDARLLASKNRVARAFSLTVLALEELAKPPRLFAVDPLDDSEKWRAFWRDFSRHLPKQEAIGRYGQFLEASGFDIYEWRMTETVTDSLDRLKQWGFYVDCVDGSFRSPDVVAADLLPILDFLFATAQERADSFAQFHASVEQSTWCFEHRRVRTVVPGSLWPPPLRSDIEVRGLLVSLASRYSRSEPPNYYASCDACEQIAAVVGLPLIHDALAWTVSHCHDRSLCSALESAAKRGFLMMKLMLMALPEDRRKRILGELKSS